MEASQRGRLPYQTVSSSWYSRSMPCAADAAGTATHHSTPHHFPAHNLGAVYAAPKSQRITGAWRTAAKAVTCPCQACLAHRSQFTHTFLHLPATSRLLPNHHRPTRSWPFLQLADTPIPSMPTTHLHPLLNLPDHWAALQQIGHLLRRPQQRRLGSLRPARLQTCQTDAAIVIVAPSTKTHEILCACSGRQVATPPVESGAVCMAAER